MFLLSILFVVLAVVDAKMCGPFTTCNETDCSTVACVGTFLSQCGNLTFLPVNTPCKPSTGSTGCCDGKGSCAACRGDEQLPTSFVISSGKGLVPGTVEQGLVNGSAWANVSPQAVAAVDNASITTVALRPLPPTLFFSNFGWPAAPSWTVVGISFSMTRVSNSTLCGDRAFSLVRGRVAIGSLVRLANWTTSEATVVIGGSNVTWGGMLNASTVASSAFGFSFDTNVFGSVPCSMAINALSMRVFARFDVRVTSLFPNTHPSFEGGHNVVVRGSGFAPTNLQTGVACVVVFGSSLAEIVSVSPIEIVVRAPRGKANETVAIRVSFDSGITYTAPLYFQYGTLASPLTLPPAVTQPQNSTTTETELTVVVQVPTSPPMLPTAAIAGALGGIIAAAVVLGALGYLYWARRKRQATPAPVVSTVEHRRPSQYSLLPLKPKEADSIYDEGFLHNVEIARMKPID